MKKIMWIVAMIPVVVTSVVLQFMPDIIPMHHDLEGNTDRWGSKTESFIFPVIILFITLFWHLLIYVFEKKSKNANTEKEQMEAKSSAKVLCVVGISQAIMFGIMHYFILYSSWIQANAGGEHAVIDIAKVSCILCGIIFIVLGNFMTKAKRNAVVGVRTVWSMHNDNTWRKSNRFGAICIIITGLLTIITTVFTSGMTGTIFMLIYLLLATIVTVVYSKKIYDKEINIICIFMREGEIPVFYGEITNEGRQLPPFVCYLLLPRFGGEYGLVNSRSFMSCFLDISLSCRDCGFSPYRCFQFLRLS